MGLACTVCWSIHDHLESDGLPKEIHILDEKFEEGSYYGGDVDGDPI